MKIDSASAKPVSGIPANGASARAGSSAANGAAQAPAGSASLSSSSSQMQELAASVASAPAFDAGRVDQIKQAIAQGHFKVNPQMVADRLLAMARELLRAGKT